MTNIFEKASKSKLTFKLSNGVVKTDDLWSLSLESLDVLARFLNKEVKESGEESFIEERSSKNETLELKFSIVKHIIKCKLSDKKESELRIINSDKKDKILQAIANKQDNSLNEMSIDDLKKELDNLGWFYIAAYSAAFFGK